MTADEHASTIEQEQSACLDRVVPEGARLLAFGENGQVEVRQSADQRRSFVLAEPGTSVFMVAVPEELPDDREKIQEWYTRHPECQPINFTVTEEGMTRREAGKPRIPGKAWQNAKMQELFERLGIQRAGAERPSTPVSKVEQEPAETEPDGPGNAPEREETPTVDAEEPETTQSRLGVINERGGPQEEQQSVGEAGEMEDDIERERAETEPEPAQQEEKPQQETDAPDTGEPEPAEEYPTLLLESQQDVRWVVLGGRGEARVEQREEGWEVAPRPGAEFVVLGVPAPEARQEIDKLATWYEDHPEARSVGYQLQEQDQQLVVAPQALETVEEQARQQELTRLQGPEISADRLQENLKASEESRRRKRVREAVGARKLPRYLESHKQAPPYLRGKSGALYVPLEGQVADPEQIEVRSQITEEHPGQVLTVETLNENTGELRTHLFVPAGGSYVVGPSEASEEELEQKTTAIRIRAGGDRAPLGSHERVQIWAGGNRLPVRSATRRTPRTSSSQQGAAQMDGVQPPEPFDYDHMEEQFQGSPKVEQGPPPDAQDVGFDQAPPEPASSPASQPEPEHSPEADTAPSPQSTQPSDTNPSAEGDELGRLAQHDGGARWRHPDEGYMNVDNWQHRGRQGEFWVSELLEAVATDEELEQLDCRVPIGLLRKGFRISHTDRRRLQEALEQLTGRISEVKVFDIDNKTYFARQGEDGVQAVGPGGRQVRSEQVRRLIARAFGAHAVVQTRETESSDTSRRPTR